MQKKIIFVYFLTAAGITLWIGAIFLAPYLKSTTSPWNAVLYAVFSPVCHQNPSRSFLCFGYPLSVCARCLGVYFGFFTGIVLIPILKGFSSLSFPKIKTLFLVSLPIGIDTLGNLLQIWSTPNWLRFCFGFVWGTILPFYFIHGISDMIIHLTERKEAKR